MPLLTIPITGRSTFHGFGMFFTRLYKLKSEIMETKEDRVRQNTSRKQNQEVDLKTKEQVRKSSVKSKKEDITSKIEALEREWDIERALEMNAASLGLTGVLLGSFVNRKWLILPGVVTAFLIQHALQGWCPPLPLLRKLGFRTRQEIDREKYALKALRGDFTSTRGNPEKSWEAVNY